MDDNSAFTYGSEKSAGSIVSNILFSHVGMFFLVSLYACGGAQIFVSLEHAEEESRYHDKMSKAVGIQQTIEFTTRQFWYLSAAEHNHTEDTYNVTMSEELQYLENFILDAVNNHYYDGSITGWKTEWTFMNCLLLTMTIMTTIGYGHIAPKTFEGQMFCICYAMIGSPLFLVFLANLGNSMANGFTYLYSRVFCRCCRSRRYVSELPEHGSKKWKKQLIDDIVGDEDYMPTSKMFVPIVINLVVLHAYMIVGAILFSSFEDWDLTGSFYFTFITLSTIGYGDYVPGKSLTETSGDEDEQMITMIKMIIVVLYIVLGMAMLSMCINLMQEQIVDKCRWLAREVGLGGSGDKVEKPKPQDKRKDSMAPIMAGFQGPSPFRQNPDDIIGKPGKKKKKDKKKKKEKKQKTPLPGTF